MLRWAEVSNLTMEDVRFDTTGLVLHIRKSKTDQLGLGTYVRINMMDLEHCPVEITRLYIRKLNYGTENGFLQPQVRSFKDGSQSGVWYRKLGYSTALEDTKAFMAILGRDPRDFGEHSGRRGGATAASEAGVSWIDLKRHGRWSSDSAPQRYIEDTKKKANTVAAALAKSAAQTHKKTKEEAAIEAKIAAEAYKERYRDKGNRVEDWERARREDHEEACRAAAAAAEQAARRHVVELRQLKKRPAQKPAAVRTLLPTFVQASAFKPPRRSAGTEDGRANKKLKLEQRTTNEANFSPETTRKIFEEF